jgi:hypothetical protein
MTLRDAPRFGLTSGPDTLDVRERNMILNALRNQRMYSVRLAKINKDEEAKGRNMVNALEIQVLMEKLEAMWEGDV